MSPAEKALASASAESRVLISASNASCLDAAEHVRQSKLAMAQSLDLLSTTLRGCIASFTKVD